MLEPLLALASACSSVSLLFCINEVSAISSAAFSFSASAILFADDLFDGLEELDFDLFLDDLPDLSCFSTSLSQLCTLCLKEKTFWSIS